VVDECPTIYSAASGALGTTAETISQRYNKMPSLNEAQQPAPENYVPVEPHAPPPPIGQAATGNLLPRQNPNMRCPVPQTNFSADAQTQFYRGTTIPQFRTFAPASLATPASSGGGGSTTTNVVSTSSSTTEIVQLQVTNASVTTPVLNPNQNYALSTPLSRVFLLLHLSTTSAARVRIYSTTSAQTLDLSRAATGAPDFARLKA